MAEENYEAIGRYVAAQEKARSKAAERHNLLGDLSRLISDTLNKERWEQETFSKFDADQAARMVERARALDTDIAAAVDEANRSALAAKKPPLKRV